MSDEQVRSPQKGSSKDLLLCENPYFLEQSKLSHKLNFKSDSLKKSPTLKTEKFTSNVLSRVKGFLEKIKTNDPECVNIENHDDEEEVEESQDNCDSSAQPKESQSIELNLLLFKQDAELTTDDSDSDDSDCENTEMSEQGNENVRKVVEVIE